MAEVEIFKIADGVTLAGQPIINAPIVGYVPDFTHPRQPQREPASG
jgi:hypothetical protein